MLIGKDKLITLKLFTIEDFDDKIINKLYDEL